MFGKSEKKDKVDHSTLLKIFDTDLPPSHRTQAIYWENEYRKMWMEVNKSNKGIRRLRAKVDRLQEKLSNRLQEKVSNCDCDDDIPF